MLCGRFAVLCLVIDDDVATAGVVQSARVQDALIAAFSDLSVVAVPDAQAIKALHEHQPSIAIVDLTRPASPHFHLLDLLRADALGRDLPTIVVTGAPAPSDLEANYGVIATLNKPLEITALVPALRRALDLAKARSVSVTSSIPSLEQLIERLVAEPGGRTSTSLSAVAAELEVVVEKPTEPAPSMLGAQHPARIGEYIIEELISAPQKEGERRAGAMGVVYRARHQTSGKNVAIKALLPEVSVSPELHERFRREPRVASRLGHPNIVEVLDYGATRGASIYFVMEYLQGCDLRTELKREHELPVHRAVVIAMQICDALGAAHNAGLIHRDLKPGHVFLSKRGDIDDFVKILDFGLVKVEQMEAGESPLTRPGIALGTPTYMAPEQGEAASYDQRVDIYAVGSILYEMLTGRPPHICNSLTEAIVRKATEPITPVEELRPKVSLGLQRLLKSMLQYDANARPQTMQEIAHALRDEIERPPAVLRLLDELKRRR